MKCCYLTDELVGCGNEAEFTIHGADPYDITEACEAHVGALLGSPATGPLNESWSVMYAFPPPHLNRGEHVLTKDCWCSPSVVTVGVKENTE